MCITGLRRSTDVGRKEIDGVGAKKKESGQQKKNGRDRQDNDYTEREIEGEGEGR